MQALRGMHQHGLGVCDIKRANLLVHFADSNPLKVCTTVMDAGGSGAYQGTWPCVCQCHSKTLQNALTSLT